MGQKAADRTIGVKVAIKFNRAGVNTLSNGRYSLNATMYNVLIHHFYSQSP